MDVHEVQVEEEAFTSVIAQELDGRVRNVEVGSLQLSRARVSAVDLATLGTADRRHIGVEALLKAEVRRHPAIAPDPRGPESRLQEQLGGKDRLFRNRVVVAEDSVLPRVRRGPERGHRRLRPARLRDDVFEHDAVRPEIVENRAGVTFVSVDSQAIRPQCIDQQEDDIQVVAPGQDRDVFDRSLGPGGNLQSELARDCGDQQQGCRTEVQPRRSNMCLNIGASLLESNREA